MAALALGATAVPVPGPAQQAMQRPTIVLVHGGFVDGSGWQGVYKILRKDGYTVRIVQNPTISLAGDVAATRLIVDAQEGHVLLVGHSYGGAVITEAGNDPKVAGLVYITAFAPDKGESVNSLIKDPPPGAPVPPILPPQEGYLFLDRAKFAASFAGDVNAETAAFMAESQVPWGVEALAGAITEPAWKSKPSWYLIVTDDRMIPPPAQRFMSKRAGSTVRESPGSHAIYVSRPAPVVALIERPRGRWERPLRAKPRRNPDFSEYRRRPRQSPPSRLGVTNSQRRGSQGESRRCVLWGSLHMGSSTSCTCISWPTVHVCCEED